MRKILVTLALVALVMGCSSTAQRKSVNTISTVEAVSTAAVDSYFTLVIQGQLPEDDLPKVAQAYDSLQAALRGAVDATQANTNALAPGNLILLQTDLLNIINQAKQRKK